MCVGHDYVWRMSVGLVLAKLIDKILLRSIVNCCSVQYVLYCAIYSTNIFYRCIVVS